MGAIWESVSGLLYSAGQGGAPQRTLFQRKAKREEYLIAGKVDYSPWLSKIGGDGVRIEYSPGTDLSKLDVFKKMNENFQLKSLYFRKSKDWRDESEHRWLLFDPTEDPIYVPIDNAIKAVVLGSKFPPNQFSQVKAYCQEFKIPYYLLKYRHPRYEMGKGC